MTARWHWVVGGIAIVSATGWTDPRHAAAGLAILPNMKVTGIEVTQGIQDLANSVPLVTGKNTYVRVHVQVASGPPVINDVGAVLVGARVAPGPTVLLGGLAPLNDNGDIAVRRTPSRLTLDHSFLFQLPPSWRVGTLELAAVLDPDDDVAESNETDNTLLGGVEFEAVPPVRVRLHNVDYPGGALPAPNHYEAFVPWILNAYPSKSLLVTQRTYPSAIDWPDDDCNCPRDSENKCIMAGTCDNDPARACTKNGTCGCGRLNGILMYLRALDQVYALPGVFQPDTRYVGWVDDGAGFMRGCSPGADEKVASGPVGPDDFGWDTDGSYADWYTGHELGHALGRPHAPCCDAVGDAVFPYPNCELSDGGDSFLGFDFRTRAILFPSTWHDVMSYCDFQWPSDFTYLALRDRLLLEGGAPPPPPGGIGDFVMVQGDADLDLDLVALRDIYVLRGVRALAPPASSGEFAVQLFDVSNVLLGTFPFDVQAYFDDPDLVPDGVPRVNPNPLRVAPILQAVPLLPGTTRIAVTRLGAEQASRLVTPNAPLVTLLSPNGGETLAGEVIVSWAAADLDGDPLTATLLYSSDGGMSWTAIATQISAGSLAVALDGLAGSSTALFRVQVSDGFNTGEDQSDAPFAVADSPPDVVIISPGDRSVYRTANVVSLEAQANDVEDGALDGAALVWSSDRQGALGSGAALERNGLVRGTHVITVSATDSNGNRATDTITLFVEDDVPVAAPALSSLGLALACLALLAVSRARLRSL